MATPRKYRDHEPRAMDGKVRKHHWFKNGFANMMLMKFLSREGKSRQEIREHQKQKMYSSISDLMKDKK